MSRSYSSSSNSMNPSETVLRERDESSLAISRSSSSSSSSVSTGASSSQSSSLSSFFYRGRIAHPKLNTTLQPQPPLKAASFDPTTSRSAAVPNTRPIKSWPLRQKHHNHTDWNRLVTTSASSSTVMSLSSSEEEEVFMDPHQQQKREDRKVQRLVHLAKQHRNLEFEAATIRGLGVPAPFKMRERIIPAVAVKPILDIAVAPTTRGPVDSDTGFPWTQQAELEDVVDVDDDDTSSFTSSKTPTSASISLKRDAASFESDETRRISNKTRTMWNPNMRARDLELALSPRSPASPPVEAAPEAKSSSKSFWRRKSTMAAILAVILLIIAIVSLSMVFVGEIKNSRPSKSSASNNNKGMEPPPLRTFPPTVSPNSRTYPSQNTSSSSSSTTPLNHTPPLHLHRLKPTRSPTRRPSIAPSSVPSIAPTTAFSAAVWNQVGQSIQGKEDKEQLGSSLALSRNGQVLAVGSRNFTIGNATQAGRVQVFAWNVSRWVPRGQVLLGLSPVAHFGSAVALNRHGTIVAVSEPTLTSGALYRSGGVRIFEWNHARSVWIGIGQIVGLSAFDYFGLSLALSDDGTRLVVGSPYHASNRGQIRVLDYNGTDWELLTSLDGSMEFDWFGWDVTMSEDGNLICTGAPHNARGYVRCFQQGSNATTWIQVGEDILNDDGTVSSSDSFGNSVSISTWNGGHYVAVGAPFKSVQGAKVGFAAVYQLQQAKTNATVHQHYTLVGSPIFGTVENDQLGFVVKLLNGHLVVTSPGSHNEQGQVGIYRWTGTEWESRNTPLMSSINVLGSQQDFGYALGLAQPDNQTLLMAVGAPVATVSNSHRVGAAQVYTTTGL